MVAILVWINKINTTQAKELFKSDDWYQPMLFFSQYKVEKLTTAVIKKYLESKGLEYKLDMYNEGNYKFDISSTNQYDLKCIFKRDGTHFYTDHVYNKVNSVVYMDNTPVYQDEIIVNIEHRNGWLVDKNEWEHFLNHRHDVDEDVQEIRDDKLANLLEDDNDEKMAKDFNFHLIRHMRAFTKEYSNSFVDSVYDFYKRKGYITKRQLDSLKKTMYYDKRYMY